MSEVESCKILWTLTQLQRIIYPSFCSNFTAPFELGIKHGLQGQTRAQRQGDFKDNSNVVVLNMDKLIYLILWWWIPLPQNKISTTIRSTMPFHLWFCLSSWQPTQLSRICGRFREILWRYLSPHLRLTDTYEIYELPKFNKFKVDDFYRVCIKVLESLKVVGGSI